MRTTSYRKFENKSTHLESLQQKKTKNNSIVVLSRPRWNHPYARVSMLTKLKYAGVSIEELLYNYKQFIRVNFEYCSIAWHSAITEQQAKTLERCQLVCLRVILGDNYVSHDAALEMTGLQTLSERRKARCLKFGLKSVNHPQNRRFFPPNPNLNIQVEARQREPYHVNFARTEHYKNSAIPYILRLLNQHEREKIIMQI